MNPKDLKENIQGMVKLSEVNCVKCNTPFKKGDFADYVGGKRFRCKECMQKACDQMNKFDKKIPVSRHDSKLRHKHLLERDIAKKRWCPKGCGKKVTFIKQLSKMPENFYCSGCDGYFTKEDMK